MATTALLQKAISEIEKLPADQQDSIAARLLAEINDEQGWSDRFNATTDQQWDRLAQLVDQEIDSGYTTSLDDLLPKNSDKQ
jgi:hypothetical protein